MYHYHMYVLFPVCIKKFLQKIYCWEKVLGSILVSVKLVVFSVRGLTHDRLLIYLATTLYTNWAKLSQTDCLLWYCLISEFGTACIPRYREKNLMGHSSSNLEINILSQVSPLTVVLIIADLLKE